jgi:hypothetical protein
MNIRGKSIGVRKMKASDLFVKCLEAEGVKRIFGVPGEENADLMLSLMDSDIDFVLCRHEQGAAFMADTYGRLTGKAGVCLATLGPGATNLVTGLADAQYGSFTGRRHHWAGDDAPPSQGISSEYGFDRHDATDQQMGAQHLHR